ncbi:22451_t:CDS:10, partial [Gigaspora margarita]
FETLSASRSGRTYKASLKDYDNPFVLKTIILSNEFTLKNLEWFNFFNSIIHGKREKVINKTSKNILIFSKECWKHDAKERPTIQSVNKMLDQIIIKEEPDVHKEKTRKISYYTDSKIILTPKERYVYLQLFQIADVDKKGVIEGRNAINFFSKSGLSQITLKDIWNLADNKNKGYLTLENFIIAIRLVAKAQNGQNPSLDDINTGVCLPHFDGYPVDDNIEFSNFVISNEDRERYVYLQLFQLADVDKKGVIDGQNGINFFNKSGLSRTTLKDIWNLADNKNKGYLTLKDFIIAVRLIAKAQNGQNLSLDDINTGVCLPQFDGCPIDNIEFSNFVISNEDRERYKQMFVTLNPNNGVLDGENAKQWFLRSKLPVDKLKRIWDLADTKQRGKLNLAEFIIAMYFVQCTMSGQTLPEVLPNELYEKEMRMMKSGIIAGVTDLPNNNCIQTTITSQLDCSSFFQSMSFTMTYCHIDAFIQAWKHPNKNLPEIDSIWKIYCTETLNSRYGRYREKVEAKQLLAATSSKSDDYNSGSLNILNNISYKVMFLNKVVVGKGCLLTKDNGKLSSPPTGYDSILGEPSTNGSLNYDEIVVFKDEASIPQYLIVYKVK